MIDTQRIWVNAGEKKEEELFLPQNKMKGHVEKDRLKGRIRKATTKKQKKSGPKWEKLDKKQDWKQEKKKGMCRKDGGERNLKK